MKVSDALREVQTARFAALDPLLPDMAPRPEGDPLSAALPDGRRVAGVLARIDNIPGSLPSLWSARYQWELFPLVGEHAGAGLDALLRAWRAQLDRTGPPTEDSSCVVTWPSRDGEVTRVLLDHGFVPLSVLAVRAGKPPVPTPLVDPGITVRRATPADVDIAVRIALAELEYSALFGGTVRRPDEADLKQASLTYRIERGDPVWLAERDGVAIGLAECWLTETDPKQQRYRFPVPAGRWGYVNSVSVLPGARGAGVGRKLMAVVHRELQAADIAGTYLYYNPPNPLSSVFWPRQGYRPLWTIWEVRPAGALR